MEHFEDRKVFVKAIIAAKGISPDLFYQIVQMIQHKEDKYFVVMGNNCELIVCPVRLFECK